MPAKTMGLTNNMAEIVIKPVKTFGIDFRELWKFRELFSALALRDLKVRYKQTAIGIFWAILQPFILMVVFSIFFGRIAGLQTGNIPYPIFAYTGLLFWTYFSASLTSAAASMVANQAIVQKIYFPRLILPLSSALVHLIDFVFAGLVLIGLMIYYQFSPTLVGLALIIPALIITTLAFAGLGLVLASVNVKYRDVRYVLPFFIQILLFVTPVIYPASILGKYAWLWYLNPMAGVIDAMRAGLLGTGIINWPMLGASALMSILLFILGLIYFNKTEKYFADLV